MIETFSRCSVAVFLFASTVSASSGTRIVQNSPDGAISALKS